LITVQSAAQGESASADPLIDRRQRRTLIVETVVVLGLSLGKSMVYSILSIIEKLTRPTPLNQQTTPMNSSVTPDRTWLGFLYQLAGNLFPFFVPALCIFLIWRAKPASAQPFQALGMDGARKGFDFAWGFGAAAAIGIPGLGLYLLARQLGINTIVAPGNLTAVWWAIPMYCLAAFMNGVLEEVVMIGYLFVRWRQAGVKDWTIIVVSALIRGGYHLYQGFGGFIGNAIMGVAFGYFYKRTGRLWPLIIAHTLLDIVSFVGYALLRDVLPWLG